MQNPYIARMMHKERHVRNGKVMLNLLKYDVLWVAQHWGFLGKESACDFFQYVVDLFNEEMGKKPKSSKKSLPKSEASAVAKAEAEDLAGQERKELL